MAKKETLGTSETTETLLNEPKKTLGNTNSNQAKKNVSDLVIWGDSDVWKLISKASSEKEGWMKSTKALQIDNEGCLIQVTTQQRNADGSYAISEAVTYVEYIKIVEIKDKEANVVNRKLVSIDYQPKN